MKEREMGDYPQTQKFENVADVALVIAKLSWESLGKIQLEKNWL